MMKIVKFAKNNNIKLTISRPMNKKKSFAFEVGRLGRHIRHLARKQNTNYSKTSVTKRNVLLYTTAHSRYFT